jgi:hypothetical protein
MAFLPHLRLTASGEFKGASGGAAFERFSWRLNIEDGTLTGNTFNQDALNDYAADIAAFHASPGAKIHINAWLTEVKLAKINALGKYVGEPLINTMQVQGGSSAVYHPPQVSLAVSLNTERRGASGKGRFFLPAPAMVVDSTTGLVAAADAQGVATAVKTLLDGLNNTPGIDASTDDRVIVASNKGFSSRVTSVRVGRALDTIRSRRTSLSESYGVSLDLA